MRKVIFAAILFVISVMPVSATELHVVALSQDYTEIEVSVDQTDWQTKELEKGLNYISFNSEKIKPSVEIMSYGDVIPLTTVQGKSGDWYSIVRLAPPTDGDGNDIY